MTDRSSGKLGRADIIGTSTALVGLAYILTFAVTYSRWAPTADPRWLAANGFLFDLGVLALMSGGAAMLIFGKEGQGSWFGRALGVVFGAVAVLVVVGTIPSDLADATGPLERRTVEISSWTYERNGTPVIELADGTTYRWAENFGFYEYPRRQPGRYEIALTAQNRRVVGAERVE